MSENHVPCCYKLGTVEGKDEVTVEDWCFSISHINIHIRLGHSQITFFNHQKENLKKTKL